MLLHVVGTRPNFVKIASVIRALERADAVEQVLVHTGQHYDHGLSDAFFEDLDLPRPDVDLAVGSGSHALQTGRIMIALDPVLKRFDPDWVVTVGDVNSTLAAALTAKKRGLRVAHVEAGLRSHDWSMPEEVNRVLTDRLSDALFTTEPSGRENLLAEGIEPERIHHVGNVMIDSLDRFRSEAADLAAYEDLGLEAGRYVLVTLHRPSNVDDEPRLRSLIQALREIRYACDVPVVWPLHPRTAQRLRQFGLDFVQADLLITEALGYREFISLMDAADMVITDSGGVQEESSVLGVPCITVRPNTERPITVECGTNRLFDRDLSELVDLAEEVTGSERRPCRPELWDGRAAERIASVLVTSADVGPTAAGARGATP